jgi:hypothetical protein
MLVSPLDISLACQPTKALKAAKTPAQSIASVTATALLSDLGRGAGVTSSTCYKLLRVLTVLCTVV